MVRQAEINKAADQRRKELVGARNEADSLAYGAEKSLRDLDGKISTDDRRALEQLIAEVRRAAQGEDVTAIRDVMHRLQEASYRLSQSASGGAEAHSRHRGPVGGGNGRNAVSGADEGEDVVEGEFRQV
jgi:molecular chaperone DnaK